MRRLIELTLTFLAMGIWDVGEVQFWLEMAVEDQPPLPPDLVDVVILRCARLELISVSQECGLIALTREGWEWLSDEDYLVAIWRESTPTLCWRDWIKHLADDPSPDPHVWWNPESEMYERSSRHEHWLELADLLESDPSYWAAEFRA